MKRFLSPLILGATFLTAAPASAQNLGTFRWQLAPYGSVLHLTITQQGSIFLLNGFEAQCGGNLSLPVSGVAVPQANETVFLGLTSINENGSGIHTRAYVNLSTLTAVGATMPATAISRSSSIPERPARAAPARAQPLPTRRQTPRARCQPSEKAAHGSQQQRRTRRGGAKDAECQHVAFAHAATHCDITIPDTAALEPGCDH